MSKTPLFWWVEFEEGSYDDYRKDTIIFTSSEEAAKDAVIQHVCDTVDDTPEIKFVENPCGEFSDNATGYYANSKGLWDTRTYYIRPIYSLDVKGWDND